LRVFAFETSLEGDGLYILGGTGGRLLPEPLLLVELERLLVGNRGAAKSMDTDDGEGGRGNCG